MKDLHTKIYKTTMNGIEEDAHKWKDTLRLWIGRTSVSILSIVTHGI